MNISFLRDYRDEFNDDARRARVVMAVAHRRLHPLSRRGWNKCDKEPCLSLGVLLDSAAVVAMNIADLPGDEAA